MNFNDLQVTLSKQEFEAIVKEKIASNFVGFEVKSINFNISTQYGFRNEILGYDLKNVEVKLGKKNSAQFL